MELISVIVPIYNMEQYLHRCIESLRVQTYQNFEIILVNDGSTDTCPYICEEYAAKDDRIRVLHKENGGLSSARNAGMDNAKGKYVIFPDPDDWVEPEYLSFLYGLQTKYEMDLAICGHFVDDKSGCLRHTEGEEKIIDRDDAIMLLLKPYGYCGFSCNKLYHLDFIREYNLLFDIELGMAQDLHFAFRYLLKCERVVYNPKPMYHYFQHAGSTTHSKLTPKRLSGLLTYKKIRDIAIEEFPMAVEIAQGSIANLSITFIDTYFESKMKDKAMLDSLQQNINENRKAFLRSKTYPLTRKILGCCAMMSPRLFYHMRKICKFIFK